MKMNTDNTEIKRRSTFAILFMACSQCTPLCVIGDVRNIR